MLDSTRHRPTRRIRSRRRSKATRLAAALFLAAGLGAGVAHTQPAEGEAQPEQPAAATGVTYTVTLTGVDGGLEEVLRETSSLVSLQEEPPPSLLGLERRAAQDRERLQTALRSAGHYDARLDIAIDDTKSPVAVTVEVQPGPVYRFRTVELRTADGAPLPGPAIQPPDIGLTPGEPALAPQVTGAQNEIIGRLRNRGYGFAQVSDRRVVVDHGDRSMNVTYTVAPGPLVRFGETRIDGLEDVKESLIRGRIPWKPGDVFDPAKLDRARTDISALGTFDLTRVTLAERPGPDGVTPVDVTVDERLARFIGFGFTYSTSEGLGVNGYWGHRNLFGGAEQLRITAEVGRLVGGDSSASGLDKTDLRLGAEFRKPDFLAPKQSLLASFAVVTDNPPAYEREAAVFTLGLERPITDQITVSYGVTTEAARTVTNDRTYRTALFGVPLAARYDGSDSLLNPTTGYRLSLAVTPWIPIGGDTDEQFVTTNLIGTAYRDITGDGNYVLAGRIGLGSAFGAGLGGIPPDKRFYAGGGGSVRGYGFQQVGPRDSQGDPTGGRSLFEAGLEMRIKVTETIGIVPFVDAGAVYDRAFPDMSEPLKFGAGLGVRYYTDFGPLRVDVGVPLNKEPEDDSWQLYISLGQAF